MARYPVYRVSTRDKRAARPLAVRRPIEHEYMRVDERPADAERRFAPFERLCCAGQRAVCYRDRCLGDSVIGDFVLDEDRLWVRPLDPVDTNSENRIPRIDGDRRGIVSERRGIDRRDPVPTRASWHDAVVDLLGSGHQRTSSVGRWRSRGLPRSILRIRMTSLISSCCALRLVVQQHFVRLNCRTGRPTGAKR